MNFLILMSVVFSIGGIFGIFDVVITIKKKDYGSTVILSFVTICCFVISVFLAWSYIK